MKSLTAVILLLALALTGCAAPPREDAGEAAKDGAAAHGQSEANGGEAGGGLVLLKSSVIDAHSCNGRGAYSLQNAPARSGFASQGRVAVFTDFETGVRAPLCRVEGCRHDADGCTAFFHALGATNVLACDDLLVWIAGTGGFSGPPDNPDGDPSVFVSDTDGQNRRLVLRLSGQVSIDGARAGYDGRYLYLIKTVYANAADGGTKRETSVVKVDVAQGGIAAEYPVVLFDGGDAYFVSLAGVWGGELVVKGALFEDGLGGQTEADAWEYRQLDPADGDVGLLARFEADGLRYGLYFDAVDGGEVLALTGDGQSLGWYDPAGGGFREIVRCPDEVESMAVGSVADGLVMLYCRVDGKSNLPYVAELESGEIYPARLSYRYAAAGYTRPADILGVFGDEYLVVCGDDYYAETAVVDGMPVSYYTDHLVLAMISRDDYRAGIPNYRYISEEG